MAVKFPGPTDRVYIIGRTGSGKTTAALWHLSGKDFNLQPWVVVNTKGDTKINELAAIEGVKTISVNDTPGDRGLFHVRPHPDDEAEELDAFFGRIWEKTNCGVFVDEGYMIQIDNKLNSLLTQGRDRRIPMMVLTQRPTWITKFVESEADYVQLFGLSRRDDRKNVMGLVPVDRDYRLAPHCSYWYNVSEDSLVQFGPVPKSSTILDSFRAKFPPDDAQQPEADASKVQRQPVKRVV